VSGFVPDERHALELDAADPLAPWRERFHLPRRAGSGEPAVYFAGNSLGLQPKATQRIVDEELEDWARLAVDAHFEGRRPWYDYHERFRERGARLVGARPGEIVMMNGLTVNLHLMLVTFYRPTRDRYKILMEDAAFPSDTYAVASRLGLCGHDPADALVIAAPRSPGGPVSTESIAELLLARGEEIALVLLPGVNYFTGQAFEMGRLTALAQARGCTVGLDLAHAAGNLELELHDWGVDFAVWCSYKYLNAGPGAVAGCFVHERHGQNPGLPRLAGWWGNDPRTRFRMHLESRFVPRPGADGWQLSNPPILALAPLDVSLGIFDEVGMAALRAKSRRLTGYLEAWVDHAAGGRVELLTPREPDSRGCQLSLRVLDRPQELFRALRAAGIVGDFRPPDVVRVAPVPLYNRYHDVWRFGRALAAWASGCT
jgi:kynureninase